MLTIRLARNGAKKRPFYHIVVSENDRIPTGRAIEILGFHNPIGKDGAENFRLDAAKAKAWLDKGAQPSKTVAELFEQHKALFEVL
jgi:small subunit ribosomal protein S16